MNKAKGEIAIAMMGAITLMDELDTTVLDSIAKRRVKTIKTHAEALLKELISSMTDNQLRSMKNYADNVILMPVPRLSPEAKRTLSIVDSKLLLDISKEVCPFCIKNPRDTKKCEFRQALERAGLAGQVEGTKCPFRIIDED